MSSDDICGSDEANDFSTLTNGNQSDASECMSTNESEEEVDSKRNGNEDQEMEKGKVNLITKNHLIYYFKFIF